MRSSSVGRKSSINPVRISNVDLNDRSHAASEPRPSNIGRPRGAAESGIPRRRAGSSSLDRASIQRSHLKAVGTAKSSGVGYNQYMTPVTSKLNSRSTSDLASGVRGRSPSAERASGMGGPPTLRKDTRPLNDKNFQQQMLQRVDGFFRDAGRQECLNTNGSIKPMSLKIFITSTNLLLKLLDMKIELNATNYIEEIPKISVRLQYAGSTNKSWLKTVNTMHSWPHVLGWLCWLVEICEVKDVASEKFQYQLVPFAEGRPDDERLINRPQMQKIFAMYEAWNSMDEQEEVDLAGDYIKIIADQCGYNQENLSATEKRYEETKEKYSLNEKRFNETEGELNALVDTLNLLEMELQKLNAEKENFDQFVANSNIEYDKLIKEDAIYDSDIEKYLMLQKQLENDLEHQVISPEERDAILEDCAALADRCKASDVDIESLQKQDWRLEIERSNNKETLNKIMYAYNRDIRDEYDGYLKDLLLPLESLSGKDIKELVNEKSEMIKKMNENYNKFKYELNTIIENAKKRAKDLNNELKTEKKKDDDRLCLKNKMADLFRQKQLSKQKDDEKFETLLRQLNETFQNRKEEIEEHLKNIELIENRVLECEEKLEAVERRRTFLHNSADSFFKQFCQLMATDIKNMAEIASRLKQ